ncbi:hypothetical protein [Lacrimispora sp.]|uniref:hypothetical protein n=1 Tax=Lacrimispora sp. TaxID=2719234 RepID=UPI0028A04C7C|nr:hypothetical protein [Lacrimispora sp.]
MLRLNNMNAPIKILLVTIFLFGIGISIYKSDIVVDRIISHDEKWLTPFESITTTIYDLGDGFTSTVTTTTVKKITSVGHADEGMFSAEQWDEILSGIANGSIVWED